MSNRVDDRHYAMQIQRALGQLRAGDPKAALATVNGLHPEDGDSDAHFLIGQICVAANDLAAAERAFRAALAADRFMVPAVKNFAELLNRIGRPAEALEVTTPLAALPECEYGVLVEHSDAQNRVGMTEASLQTCLRIADQRPHSAVAEHNVAARLGDLRRYAEAQASAERAFAKGSKAAETWLVYGRALQGQNMSDSAEAAYRRAILEPSPCLDAHLDLAQLVWMRTGEVAAACSAIDEALVGRPGNTKLSIFKSRLLEFAEDSRGAHRTLLSAIAQSPQPSLVLELAAADSALTLGDLSSADFHARRASDIASADSNVLRVMCDLKLAFGHADEAVYYAKRLHRLMPGDQSIVARLATGWRMIGDPQYRDLYDYDQFVGRYEIDPPPGWSNLSDYLSDLTTALDTVHGLEAHPIGQSLRGGTQTMENLLLSNQQAIQAFFKVIDTPIRRFLKQLGQGSDPLRRLNFGGYSISGAWSIRLRPMGFHTDHIHPKGWLSSAFYVETPTAIDRDGREGWLKFGQPGIKTQPSLEAEYWVKPQAGTLVLFPSYMWHGTVPFSSADRRLSIAFDVIPGQPK